MYPYQRTPMGNPLNEGNREDLINKFLSDHLQVTRAHHSDIAFAHLTQIQHKFKSHHPSTDIYVPVTT